MIAKETIKFLEELKKNNDRDWFNDNKPRYVAANDNIIAVAGDLIARISKFDESIAAVVPKSCVFRIYRDTRFSADKSPYKTNMGGYIAAGGRSSGQPGYYFHIEPGGFFLAAGKHMPNSTELLAIRKRISKDLKAFAKIVETKRFRDRFGELHGDKLVRPPKGFDADDPAIEYLKLKSYTVSETLPAKIAAGSEFSKHAAESFEAAFPLVKYLRDALAG